MKSVHHKENSSEDDHHLLFKAILALKTTDEASRFFQDLCTPAELQDFVDRWRVVEPLQKGIPYRKIYELTGVSVTTIGRVARVLKYGTGGYELILKRVKRAANDKRITPKNRTTKKRSLKQRIA